MQPLTLTSSSAMVDQRDKRQLMGGNSRLSSKAVYSSVYNSRLSSEAVYSYVYNSRLSSKAVYSSVYHSRLSSKAIYSSVYDSICAVDISYASDDFISSVKIMLLSILLDFCFFLNPISNQF